VVDTTPAAWRQGPCCGSSRIVDRIDAMETRGDIRKSYVGGPKSACRSGLFNSRMGVHLTEKSSFPTVGIQEKELRSGGDG
jgi:hypothetical protein